FGTPGTDDQTILFYSDSSCGSQFAISSGSDQGDATIFSTTGLTIAVQPNTRTDVYAAALDEAGNTSTCTFMGTYTFENAKPNPPSIPNISPG
ncbi:hypothetical protein, partial [Shewanella algae]|uniref:hypothetical protein n=1 Tax=Shewanella algae TaxID=38313 RepID=UPI00313C48DC